MIDRRGSKSLPHLILLPIFIAILTCSFRITTYAVEPPSAKPAAEPSQAVTDSVRLAEFLAQPEELRDRQAKQARQWREKAEQNTDGPRVLDLLQNATAADPTDPWGWLRLAETRSWMGYPDQAAAALASARFAMKDVKGKPKREFVIEYSLARAWLAYEQADWAEGENWANRAVKLDAGLRAHLIAGLNRAARVYSEPQMRESLGVFRPFDRNTNRPANWEWIYRLWTHLHGAPWSVPDIWGYEEPHVKVPEHNLTRWRDFGMLFEIYEEGHLAVRFYRKSLNYLPVRDGGWLQEYERIIPGAKPSLPAMPFWTNQENDYVTGSLLAYQGHCHHMMEQATDPAVRAMWAQHVVRAGGAAVHRYPKRPWTRLWRGSAYLELDMLKEAENDITYARSWFDEFEIVEPALNPIQGHIILLDKNYGEALPILEQAARDFPDNAAVWADLGVARVMKVGRDPAREAFDRALALDPKLSVAWHNRGLVNLQDGRTQEARDDLEAAAELAPDDQQIRGDLARVRQLLERTGQ